jgi:hypothetical protein
MGSTRDLPEMYPRTIGQWNKAQKMKDEAKSQPQSEREPSLSDAAMERTGGIKDEVKPKPRNEEYSLADPAVVQVEEIMVEAKAEPRSGVEEKADEVKPEPQSEAEHSISDAATERAEEVTEEVKPEPQSGEEHSLLDAGKIWVEDVDELPEKGKARSKPAKLKIRSRNRKARRKNARRNANSIGQLEEITSCLSNVGSIQGGLHLTVTVNHIHTRSYHATAAPTAPNVNNVTAPNVNNVSIVNSNTSSSFTCVEPGSDTDSDEGSCYLGKHWRLMLMSYR